MRRVLLPGILILVQLELGSCGSVEASATKLDDRTFRIEGPGVPGGAEAPNRRMALRLCPGGYRVLDQLRYTRDISYGISTDWIIRCL
jgi:hypothetical protein